MGPRRSPAHCVSLGPTSSFLAFGTASIGWILSMHDMANTFDAYVMAWDTQNQIPRTHLEAQFAELATARIWAIIILVHLQFRGWSDGLVYGFLPPMAEFLAAIRTFSSLRTDYLSWLNQVEILVLQKFSAILIARASLVPQLTPPSKSLAKARTNAPISTMPRVSIIINNYNYAHFLGPCIQSALGSDRVRRLRSLSSMMVQQTTRWR